jgi:hypothetical protein
MRYCTGCGEPLGGNIRCDECLTFDVDRLEGCLNEYYRDVSLSDPDDPRYIHPETFYEKVRILYPRLERAAIDGQKTGYEAITGDGIGIFRRGYYLGGVGVVEHHDGRPLLPSVVVRRERGALTTPGDGYFSLVRYLTAPSDGNEAGNPSERQQESRWATDLADVWAFWEGREYEPPDVY